MFETATFHGTALSGDEYRRAADQGGSLAQYSRGVLHENRQASTKKAGISADLVCWR